MACPSYMTVTGKVQGLISAGCSTQASIGNKTQSDHADEIMVMSILHHMEYVGHSRHATHHPVVITKVNDKSSALLAQAMANREELTCKIDCYRISASGIREKYYTFELEGAVIDSFTADLPHCVTDGEGEHQEHMAIRYRNITWTHTAAGTTGYASWGETES